MTQSCPSPAELRNLVHGTLSDLEARPLELHLDECQTCQQALQEIAADETFWVAATTRLGDEKVAEPELDRVMETLQQQSLAEAEEIGEAIELKLSFIEPAIEPGTIGRLRHYDILRVADRGGMGIVLKAFDRSLRQIVAIKLLAPHLAGNGQARQRFVREGRAAAGICHEHVVTIYAVEESPPFLVMQYVHGETLEEHIHRTGSLSAREAVRIALQIAQGLAAAHAQGVVHRDIKPGNILLENGVGRVRITDFGLARAIDDASMTQSGVVAGTPQYMAPEQACGDAIDERADLFSLGSVLYTMLAGHAPFRATTAMGVLKRLCDNAARPIREINPETPEWLAVILNRLHAKSAADRFHSADEVVSLLQRGMASLQTGTAPPAVDAGTESLVPPSTVALVVSEEKSSSKVSNTAEDMGNSFTGGIASAALMDVRILFRRIMPRRPLPLFFAVLAAMAATAVPPAAALAAGISVLAFVLPKLLPSLSAKLFPEPTSKSVGAGDGDAIGTAPETHWLFGLEWKMVVLWLVLWTLPALLWMRAFFVSGDLMRSATNWAYVVAQSWVILWTAIGSVLLWTAIATVWFLRRTREGSRIFSPATRNRGILTTLGLAIMFALCGLWTWESDVVSQVQHLSHARTYAFPNRSNTAVEPTQQVQIEFEAPRDNMIVTIDTENGPLQRSAMDGGQMLNVTTAAGTYPWRAALGQSEFASGEVTLQPGEVSVINVPRPRLIDLIAGRWEWEGDISTGGEATGPFKFEFEFTDNRAILFHHATQDREDTCWDFQIDESVNPALITFTNSEGKKLPGIIRFETSQSGYGGRMGGGYERDFGGGMGMSSGYEGDGTMSAYMKDNLVICLSSGQSLRPWQFKENLQEGIQLWTLEKSQATEPLRELVALTPLVVSSSADEIRESLQAWSKRLQIPIERKNSIGMELTLVPPISKWNPAMHPSCPAKN